ncbi:MAG: hypothetical protein ACYSWU_29800 [Planctomycetota bacterium]
MPPPVVRPAIPPRAAIRVVPPVRRAVVVRRGVRVIHPIAPPVVITQPQDLAVLPAPQPATPQAHRVVRVDDNFLVTLLIDGVETPVRMVGVDPPLVDTGASLRGTRRGTWSPTCTGHPTTC